MPPPATPALPSPCLWVPLAAPGTGAALPSAPREQLPVLLGSQAARTREASCQSGLLQAVLGRVWMMLCGRVYMHGHLMPSPIEKDSFKAL